MAKRLLDAGFAAADVQVLGPNQREGNLVARIHGSGSGGLKPMLIIGHLDVVEARPKSLLRGEATIHTEGGGSCR